MDPVELAKALASGDKAQIKAAQKQLQALGYDIGPKGADGGLGPATSKAMADYKASAESAATKNTELETLRLNRDIGANKAKEAENDPVNRLVKMGTEVAPVVAGIGIGTGVGHTVFGNKKADAALGDKVSRLANNRSINSTIKNEELSKLLRGRNRSDAAQFAAPALLFGAGRFTQDVLAPKFSDKGTQDIVNSIGVGENSAASALGLHQLVSTLKSLKEGRGIDPVDVAKIRSGALPPEPAPIAPPPPPPAALPPPSGEKLPHSERLRMAVSAAGGKPGTKKADNVAAVKKSMTDENMPAVAEALKLPADANRASVLQRLREISKTSGKLALPLAAGAIAYDAASQPSEAADGTVSEPSTAGAAAAAGTAAGTTYGMQKLLSALGKAGNMAGPMMAPSMASDMTDIPQGDLNDIRNKLARNLPEWAQVGAIKDAADMSQVPEPSPMRPAPGNPNYPLSSGQIPMEAPQQAAAAPEQPQAAPQEFASLDDLAAAAEADPELAAMIRELVHARVGDAQQAQLQ